jgi:kynurenine formamidase
MPTPRWKNRPEGSTWGDFGPDDQCGRLNLLTPAKIREGIAEVKEARAFCLSLPLDYPGDNTLNPRRYPPKLRPTYRGGLPNMNYLMQRGDPQLTDVMNDDAVLLHLQYSTQWDSLAHVGQLFDANGDGMPEQVYYNGFRAHEHVVGPVRYEGQEVEPTHVEQTGAYRLGIETMAETCVQGRGVMIDLEAHLGRDFVRVGYDTMMRILEADKVEVTEGDLVCLRTGYDRVLLEMGKHPTVQGLDRCAALDGRDEKLLQWITDTGLAALISDNAAVEALPPGECHDDHCSSLPLHAHCLFRLGVPLGEMWLLSDLADWLRAHQRSRFFLTAPPLRLPGAIGSPVTPVATV